MNYENIWQKTLGKDEKIEYEFSVSDKYIKFQLILWTIIGIVLVFAFIGIFILAYVWFYYAFYIKRANANAFTDKRVLQHKGWLSTRTITVDYHMITDVWVREPFLQRVFTHSGSLSVDTASSNKINHEVSFRCIDAPYEVKKRLDALRSQK